MKEKDRLEKIEMKLDNLIKMVEKIQTYQIERIELVRVDSRTEDALYEEAEKLVIKTGTASISFLQKRLDIGYARAAKFLDMLEEKGVIGPKIGSKPRDILSTQE